ncbi:MAG TPA: hypothetical protein VNO55_19500, partial [Polyangia bacterium]|nr:hypothetical protein [Polyangia bacterium]
MLNRPLAGRLASVLTGCLSLLVAAGCGSSSPAKNPDAGTSDAPPADGGTPEGGSDVATGTPQKLVILHTNDLHSHLQGEGPEADYTPATTDDDATLGGMARLAT